MIPREEQRRLCFMTNREWGDFKKAADKFYKDDGAAPAEFMESLGPQSWAKFAVQLDVFRVEKRDIIDKAHKDEMRKRKNLYMKEYMRQYRKLKKEKP